MQLASRLQGLTGRKRSPIISNSDPPEYLSAHTKVTNQHGKSSFGAETRAPDHRRTATNRANTSSLRTQLRVLRETIEKGDKAAAEQTYRQTVSALDKAIQKGTLHGNTASRYKSRLGKRVTAMK